MTITIGWWALPALVTIVLAIAVTFDVKVNSTNPESIAMGIVASLLLSCPAWLIWALWGRG